MSGELHHGAAGGLLELRRESDGSVRLAGRFPYGVPAVLSGGGRSGRPQKVFIAHGAFNYAIEEPATEIHLLSGHSFDRPLASKLSGTLTFRDTPSALMIVATIVPAIARTSCATDALAALEAGLTVGLSPGFRLPPERAVPREKAERIEEATVEMARAADAAPAPYGGLLARRRWRA